MKKGKHIRYLLIVFLLIPLYSSADSDSRSSIVGSLTGVAQAPLKGITIRLLDSMSLKEIGEAITDEHGEFTLSNLVPGSYLLSIDLPAIAGLFKRVEVLSGGPTVVDLRSMLDEAELKDHDAWDRFKWTIRIAERSPLRDTEITNDSEGSDNFFAALRSFKEANQIEGKVSYINVGSAPSDSGNWSQQMAQFAVRGRLEDQGSWSFNGHVLDGVENSYIASGDIQYSMYGHQIGAAFAANDLLLLKDPTVLHHQMISRLVLADSSVDNDQSRQWVGSMDLNDEWQLMDRFRIGYGTRVDYYGYLDNQILYSPRFRITYELHPGFSVVGGYYRNQSAPGNYYLTADQVHPFVHNIAFVPFSEKLDPELTQGFETGVHVGSDEFYFSVLYQSEGTSNKFAAIPVDPTADTAKFTPQAFMIFNAADLESRGVEIQVSRRITGMLTAVAAYSMKFSMPVEMIAKDYDSGSQLFVRPGNSWHDYHDFYAGIAANIDQTNTEVQADLKWSSGSPLSFGEVNDTMLTAIDLEVQQALPVQVFDQAQLKLMIAIKNLLDQNSNMDGNTDFQRALIYGMPRVVAGGLLLKF